MPMKTAVDVATAAKLFRGFADPTRLAILLALVDGERRVKDLVEVVGGPPKPAASCSSAKCSS